MAGSQPPSTTPLAAAGAQRYTAAVTLEIVQYGHPVLREKGRRVTATTPAIRQLAADMLETMYAANGVGLAAQQVGETCLLTVVDVRESELPWSGQLTSGAPVPMPLVLINPVVHDSQGEQIGQEGCLSIPEVNADIRRAESVRVTAEDLDGQRLEFTSTGLLARAIQHEVDHLHGILFVDRMDAATRASLAGKLKKLQKETLAKLGKKPRRRRLLSAR